MTFFSGIKIFLEPKLERAFASPLKIRPGETLKGRVLKVKAPGTALFDFKGNKVWSNVTFPVKEKQVITVSVLETDPQLKLKLAEKTKIGSRGFSKKRFHPFFPAQKTMGPIFHEIDKAIGPKGWVHNSNSLPPRTRMALEHFFSHFAELDMKKGNAELSARLRTYIENSGIFFEKRLHDKIQALYQTHPKVSNRSLEQHFEIQTIIKNDLKPHLMLLKNFPGENGSRLEKGKSAFPLNFRKLIQKTLEGIAYQQTRITETQQEKNLSHQAVYEDPRKEGQIDSARMTENKTARISGRLISKLTGFLKTADQNLDPKIVDTLKVLVNKIEILSASVDGSKYVTEESSFHNVLREEIRQHLKGFLKLDAHRLQAFEPFDSKEIKSILKDLRRLSAEMDDKTLVEPATRRTQKTEIGQVISFILPMAEEDGRGKLKILYPRKREDRGSEGFRMSLLLHMQNIGEIRTDFALANKQLVITFFLKSHEIEKAIDENAISIKHSLAPHFNGIQVGVVVSEQKVQAFEIEHLPADNRRLIDLRV